MGVDLKAVWICFVFFFFFFNEPPPPETSPLPPPPPLPIWPAANFIHCPVDRRAPDPGPRFRCRGCLGARSLRFCPFVRRRNQPAILQPCARFDVGRRRIVHQ